MAPRSSRTSKPYNISKVSAATSGEALSRMPRAISSCSSVLASGMSMSARTLEPIPHEARTMLTRLFLHRLRRHRCAVGEGRVQHELFHPFLVFGGIADRDRTALRPRQQVEPLQTEMVDESVQIETFRFHGELGAVTIRQPVAVFVIHDHPEVAGQRLEEQGRRLPPQPFQVRRPTRHDDQRWTIACGSVGNRHPVRPGEVCEVVVHARGQRRQPPPGGHTWRHRSSNALFNRVVG